MTDDDVLKKYFCLTSDFELISFSFLKSSIN